MTKVPKPLKLLIGVLCAAVLISSLGMMFAALVLSPKPVWVLFGFEVVISVASILGMLFAQGRFQEGQGLALACVAGSIAVGSFLGWLGTAHHLSTTAGDISLNLWLAGRLGAASLLGLVGSLLVLARNPRSWSYLLKSAATGGPLLVLLGMYMLKRAAVSSALSQMPGWVTGLMATLGGLLAVVLISASVHCLIRAFEMGRTDPQP